MSEWVRGIVLLAFLALPLAAQQVSCARAEAMRPEFDLAGVPAQLADWRASGEERLDPQVLAMIAPDAYSMRVYRASGKPPVWLYLAFYRGNAAIGAHDPKICYPAQGWEITSTAPVAVPVDGAEFPATLLRTAHGGREEVVLYWFQPAERWPGPAVQEHVRRAVDRLVGRPEYAFVRLSLRRGATERGLEGPDSETLAQLAAALAPRVRAAVSVASQPVRP